MPERNVVVAVYGTHARRGGGGQAASAERAKDILEGTQPVNVKLHSGEAAEAAVS